VTVTIMEDDHQEKMILAREAMRAVVVTRIQESSEGIRLGVVGSRIHVFSSSYRGKRFLDA